MKNTKQQAFADTCRKLADFYEAHPDIPSPTHDNFNVYVEKDELPRIAKEIGSCKKNVDDTYFELVKDFGTMTISFFVYRNQVCEKVVVGKKIIPEYVIPASEERVIPEHEEDVVEWRCPDSLLTEGE